MTDLDIVKQIFIARNLLWNIKKYFQQCGKFLANDVQARRHYESEHPGTEYLKRYMCDVCGHTTRVSYYPFYLILSSYI